MRLFFYHLKTELWKLFPDSQRDLEKGPLLLTAEQVREKNVLIPWEVSLTILKWAVFCKKWTPLKSSVGEVFLRRTLVFWLIEWH